MAVGDAVIGKITATGNFQPASGVEVCLTQFAATGVGDIYSLYDGTTTIGIVGQSVTLVPPTKVFISNSFYLRYTKTNSDGSYSGVQTK